MGENAVRLSSPYGLTFPLVRKYSTLLHARSEIHAEPVVSRFDLTRENLIRFPYRDMGCCSTKKKVENTKIIFQNRVWTAICHDTTKDML